MTNSLEHLLWARAHRYVAGEVHPSHDAIRIENKFRRARNIRSFGTRAGMQHTISANRVRFRIGKQRERVPELLRLPLVDIRRIDADGDNANTAGSEIRKSLLETP